jgi:hypothetical protein
MAVVFNIDNETGNLTQYTNTSGSVSAINGAALVGSYGLNVVVSATVAWARKTATQAAVARFRFYVDPNTITMANGDGFVIQNLQQNASPYTVFEQIQLKYVSGSGYQLAIDINNDAGYLATYTQNITDAPHYVEVNFVRASGSASLDGTFEWWIDGTSKNTRASIDNYNKFADQQWQTSIGAVTGRDAGTSGTIFLDDWVLNNDGSTIGPANAATALTVANIAQAQTVGSVDLIQHNTLAIANITQGQTVDNLTLTGRDPTFQLTVQNITQSQTLDNVVLTQHNALTIQNIAQPQTLDGINLTQHNVLAAADITQNQTIGNVTLTAHIPTFTLTVADVTQSQTVDNVALVQHNVLSINNITQAQAIDAIVLTQHNVLSIGNVTQSQTLNNLDLVQHNALTVQGITQAQTVDAIALLQHNVITVQSITQSQSIDNVTLGIPGQLEIQNVTQSQVIDNLDLIQHNRLAVDNITQYQTLDSLSLGIPVIIPELVPVQSTGGGDISTHNRSHVVIMDRDNYGADDEIAAALWEMLNG